jgi:hypothetical protein
MKNTTMNRQRQAVFRASVRQAAFPGTGTSLPGEGRRSIAGEEKACTE